MKLLLSFVGGVGVLAATGLAQPIYSNVDNAVFDPRAGSVSIIGHAGDLNLNAITTDGGGVLESVTFSAGRPSFGPIGPPVFSDATVFIFADDGDMNPDDDANEAADLDQLLLQSATVGLPGLSQGDHILHTIDVSGAGVSIAPGSTLWVGVQFSDAGFGEVLYTPPAVGSTSGARWSPAIGVVPLGADTGFGFELVVPAPGAAVIGVAFACMGIRRRR